MLHRCDGLDLAGAAGGSAAAAAVARRGSAVDEQESTVGLRCFAVPLRFGGTVNEALSCSVPVVRLDADREREIVGALPRARERLAGCTGAPESATGVLRGPGLCQRDGAGRSGR
jgi:hypothetical protein